MSISALAARKLAKASPSAIQVQFTEEEATVPPVVFTESSSEEQEGEEDQSESSSGSESEEAEVSKEPKEELDEEKAAESDQSAEETAPKHKQRYFNQIQKRKIGSKKDPVRAASPEDTVSDEQSVKKRRVRNRNSFFDAASCSSWSPSDTNVLKLPAGEVIIGMQADETLVFEGQIQLMCIFGHVEVMGATLSHKTGFVPAVAPRYAPLPVVKALGSSTSSSVQIPKDYSKQVPSDWAAKFASILVLKAFIPGFKMMARAYPNQFLSFMSTGTWELPGFNLVLVPSANLLAQTLDSSWTTAMHGLQGNLVYLSFGSKGVGKSTFCKFVCNKLQTDSDNDVFYLDTDLGQSEFSPPGFLSLYKIHSPLLSAANLHPPICYTVLRSHNLGSNNPQTDPERYLLCIKDLVSYYRENLSGSLVVNSHGWVKGLGSELFSEMRQLICPDKEWEFGIDLEPITSSLLSSRMTGSERRNIATSAYFHQILDSPLQNLPTIRLPLDALEITFSNPIGTEFSKTEIGRIVSKNIIGLSEKDESAFGSNSSGLGFVNDITSDGILSIITPSTKRVDSIIIGQTEVPLDLLIQDDSGKEIAYVGTVGMGIAFGAKKTRVRRSLMRKSQIG